jgi:hypothetical protein
MLSDRAVNALSKAVNKDFRDQWTDWLQQMVQIDCAIQRPMNKWDILNDSLRMGCGGRSEDQSREEVRAPG